ncbi:hypothetical protein [Winogradskyella sp. Asnod2-B02-A]|uniref:hypothetical protein n=1 Tax=Winogradskyella sp. Asnod2-B02-A TaxID=3160583 RepID=UPI003862F89C
MLKDNHNSISNIPNPSIKKGSIHTKLIEFIEATLYKFQNQFKGEINTSEEVLNEHLGKTFSYYSKTHPFIFQAETIQKQKKGQNRKVDIGVFKHYADHNPFFTIEAKRLSNSIRNNRKKEYVVGDDPTKFTGGIERFKHNLHGVNLSNSAIIGYVQNEDLKFWYKSVNEWILELILGKIKSPLKWNFNDALYNTCNFADLRCAKFNSESEKIDKTRISLSHYFVNLC